MNIANSKTCSYNIVPITFDDKQIVKEFVINYFFRQEPLIVCLKLFEDVNSMKKLQNYGFRTMDNGLTLKAVSENGDLMGVIFNEILSRDSEEHNNHSDDNSDQEESVGFKKFMTLFQKVGQQSDVFKMYPTANRVMDIKIVAVKEAFRSQGVCKALFNKTKDLALDNDCSMLRVECSSYFSACAAEKLGFQCVYSLCYREYKNEKGELIFDSPPPHEHFKVFTLPVNKY